MSTGTATATPTAAQPVEYWKNTGLKLDNGSIDNKFAKARNRTATVPHNYVSDLQCDLIQLGYLKSGADDGSYGAGTRRAVTRFQRHARRTFRMKNGAKVIAASWGGAVTGVCDHSTAQEVRSWIDKDYRLPLGLSKLTKIDGGKLQEDVAKAWKLALAEAEQKGGTLLPPGKGAAEYYSDTWRNPANGFKSTGGNSKLSLHYTGRAIDLSMEPAGGKGQRWWIIKDPVGGDTYWILYCKTDKQDGSQGFKVAKQTKKYYEFWNNTGEKWIPEGYYIDLTAILKSHKFERIPAQSGWATVAKKREWWHFYYSPDIQETFLDEMELIGYTERQLRGWGWAERDLDQAPG